MKFSKLNIVCACLTALVCAMNVHAQTTLKDAFKSDFLIGAAVNESQFCESNSREANIVKAQFNSISPENVLKWEKIHPEPSQFDFSLADRYVSFGVKNQMFIIGHNLIWHSQTPKWVWENADGTPLNRDALLARMREHIQTVVGRYRGKIAGWDAVNEALNDNGSLRDSPWRKIIGDDYIEKAFQFAHEADPAAELYYNDYALENPAKRHGAVALIKKLQAAGIKVTGVGLQGHYGLERPAPEQIDQTISDFESLGVKVMITELDVNILPSPNHSLNADISTRFDLRAEFNPYTNGLPDTAQLQLARRYADLFSIFVKHRAMLSRVTLWGVTDGNSWLNDWPVPGRTSYPLLFDRQGNPKPAFLSVLNTARAKTAKSSRSETAATN